LQAFGQQKASHALPDANANNTTWLQNLERGEHLRHENHKIVDVGGASLKDYKRNRTATQALLMRHILINRDQHVKARLFGCGEEFTVGQAPQARVAAGLTLVPGEK
jgi:hypothetical protein